MKEEEKEGEFNNLCFRSYRVECLGVDPCTRWVVLVDLVGTLGACDDDFPKKRGAEKLDF
jgi:hypothetical protein